MKIIIDKVTPSDFAKRAMFLAWKACGGPKGMGVFQDRPDADENAVWTNILSAGDYPGGGAFVRDGEAHADYVFGRMMKLTLRLKDGNLEIADYDWTLDYQSFCRTYPNPTSLFNATASSLNCSFTKLEGADSE